METVSMTNKFQRINLVFCVFDGVNPTGTSTSEFVPEPRKFVSREAKNKNKSDSAYRKTISFVLNKFVVIHC